MGRHSSIDEATGKRLIELVQGGTSRRAAARELGLSIGSVNRYFESLPTAAAPVLATPTVGKQRTIIETAGASLWDTKAALQENYQRVLDLIAKLDAGIIEINGEYSTYTPIATHVAALKELRGHVVTSMNLMKLLIDVDEVRNFQQAVIEAIGEADEATRERIIAKLQQRRAVGFALFQS